MLIFRDPLDSVLIEAPPVRGRNALADRKAREYATTAWPPTACEQSRPPAEPMPPLPIITRIRKRLAQWIEPR